MVVLDLLSNVIWVRSSFCRVRVYYNNSKYLYKIEGDKKECKRE